MGGKRTQHEASSLFEILISSREKKGRQDILRRKEEDMITAWGKKKWVLERRGLTVGATLTKVSGKRDRCPRAVYREGKKRPHSR